MLIRNLFILLPVFILETFFLTKTGKRGREEEGERGR
jgi:hypothetical protein